MKKTIQFNPLKYPVYVMTKSTGAACNLRCDYCYYLDKEKLRPRGSSPRMSDDILEEFTRQYILAQPVNTVLFTWHGGEATLSGIDFFRRALSYQRKYADGRQIDNVLQTNGTLLNDEWCRFFKENNFLIGISIDGPQHCHDHYRKNKSGEGSFELTMRGIDLLIKHGVEFNILSVVNAYNVRFPLEVYRFFKSTGARYIQFSPVVERLDAATGLLTAPDNHEGKLTPWSVDALGYGKFLTTIFDEWVRTDVGQTFVTTFDNTLAGYVGANPGTCIFAQTCGHAAALEANGDLFACDHFVFPEYKRGNIRQQTITQMMLSPEQIRFGNDKRDNLSSVCRQCPHLRLCNGECPKNRILNIGPGEPAQNYLCRGLKHYFDHVAPYMQFMANELAHQRPPANVMLNLSHL